MSGPDATAVLLERLRAGAPGAADELVLRHAPRLRLWVRARLGPALARRLEVEDVVQETWLRVLPSLAGFEARGEAAFLKLLVTVAGHVLADTARAARAARRGATPLHLTRGGSGSGVPESRLPGAAPGPLTAVLLSEQDRRLEAALASLPAEQRRIIRLRQMEGLPAAEVARRLGRTEGAVHAAYRRALDAWARATGNGR